MAFISFDSAQAWDDYQERINDALWGVYAKDAPDGGYWEIVYFISFLSRFLLLTSESIISFLEGPQRWRSEYLIYKKFSKLVDGEVDSQTLHALDIYDFEDLERAIEKIEFHKEYFEELEETW